MRNFYEAFFVIAVVAGLIIGALKIGLVPHDRGDV